MRAIRTIAMVLAVIMFIGVLPAAAAGERGIVAGEFTYYPAFTDGPATESFYYRDGYFADGASKQDSHMVTMSMVLAYAAMEIEGSSYISDLYGKIGFVDIQTYDMDCEPTRDTVGTAIARRRIGGKDTIAVAIRGNKYGAEWANNLIAGADGDHEGLDISARKVVDRVKSYIAERDLSSGRLWVSGYSRAASIADLVGVYANENPDELSTSADDIYVYCYETPLCCASSAVYPNITCVKNRSDMFNYVFPQSWGLYTNGVEIWMGEDEMIQTYKVDLLGSRHMIAVGEKPMGEFCEEFIDFLSSELTREAYTGDFEQAVARASEIVFGRSEQEMMEMLQMFMTIFDRIKSDPRLALALLNVAVRGAFQGDSDEVYRKLADDITQLIRAHSAPEELGLTEKEYDELLDCLYPIIRAVGPLLIKDYSYKPEGESKELNFYHFGTLYVNVKEIIRKHYPQDNLALVTGADSYYGSEHEDWLLLGDADADGEVTVIDATAIQRRLADLPNDSFCEQAADADSDTELSVIDATQIQRWLASLSCAEDINTWIIP